MPPASNRLLDDSGDKPSEGGDLAARIAELEGTIQSMRAAAPTSLVPEHSGGEGTEIADTWSLAEQEAARKP